MKTLWFEVWDSLRSSLWFLPTVMALAAVAAAFETVALDERMTADWLLPCAIAVASPARRCRV